MGTGGLMDDEKEAREDSEVPTSIDDTSESVESTHHPDTWEAIALAGFALLGFGVFLGIVFPGYDTLCIPAGIMATVGMFLLFLASQDPFIEPKMESGTADFYVEIVETAPGFEEQIDEIVRRVKSTVKVRCRFCGTLNEESATTCESCGAPM